MTRAADLPNTGSQVANRHKREPEQQALDAFREGFGNLPPPAGAHHAVDAETDGGDAIEDAVRRIRKEGDRDG